jgi:hypothetical protein
MTTGRTTLLVILLLATCGCSSVSSFKDERQGVNQFDDSRSGPISHRQQPPKKTAWYVLAYQGCCQLNENVTSGPAPDLWNISFPQAGSSYPACAQTVTCNSLNTIDEPYSGKPPSHQISMTFSVTTTGTPRFNYLLNSDNTCVNSAQVRLFMERNGDNGYSDYYRWYSETGYSLPVAAYTQVTFTIPLTYTQWGSVYGHQNQTEFSNSLKSIANVGMVYGGGCFAGHGVSVSNGTAKFTLISYTVS